MGDIKLNSLHSNGKVFPLSRSDKSLEIKLKEKESLEKKVSPKDLAYDEKLKSVSRLYEKHFLRELVKAMRKTVSESSLTKPSFSEKIYRQKLDQEYVEKWGDHGGFGLSKLIYQNIKNHLRPSRSPYQNSHQDQSQKTLKRKVKN